MRPADRLHCTVTPKLHNTVHVTIAVAVTDGPGKPERLHTLGSLHVPERWWTGWLRLVLEGGARLRGLRVTVGGSYYER